MRTQGWTWVLLLAGVFALVIPAGDARASTVTASTLTLTNVTLCVDGAATNGCYDTITSAVESTPAKRTRAGKVPARHQGRLWPVLRGRQHHVPAHARRPQPGAHGLRDATVRGHGSGIQRDQRHQRAHRWLPDRAGARLNGGVGVLFHGGTTATVQNNIITGYDSEGLGFFGTNGMLFQRNLVTNPAETDLESDGGIRRKRRLQQHADR